MIGYVGVEEQVDKDFRRALLKAFLRRWRDRARGGSGRDLLVSFDEAKGALAWCGQAYRGMRTVEVGKIQGSVGRHRDFDASFLPLKASIGERWCRVDRAYHRGIELPAVSLYKVGDEYFVRDGNHRVSVARYHGVAAIDAEVVEIRGRVRAGAELRAVRAGGGRDGSPAGTPPRGWCNRAPRAGATPPDGPPAPGNPTRRGVAVRRRQRGSREGSAEGRSKRPERPSKRRSLRDRHEGPATISGGLQTTPCPPAPTSFRRA